MPRSLESSLGGGKGSAASTYILVPIRCGNITPSPETRSPQACAQGPVPSFLVTGSLVDLYQETPRKATQKKQNGPQRLLNALRPARGFSGGRAARPPRRAARARRRSRP